MSTVGISSPSREFDIFIKKGKQGWSYKGSVKAKTTEEAKRIVLADTLGLKVHNIAVYPKR